MVRGASRPVTRRTPRTGGPGRSRRLPAGLGRVAAVSASSEPPSRDSEDAALLRWAVSEQRWRRRRRRPGRGPCRSSSCRWCPTSYGGTVGVLVGRGLQRRLDLRRGGCGVGLEQLRDDARDVRGGHRGAADRVVVAALLRVEPRGADRQVDPARAGDVLTRRRDVRVGRLVAAPCRGWRSRRRCRHGCRCSGRRTRRPRGCRGSGPCRAGWTGPRSRRHRRCRWPRRVTTPSLTSSRWILTVAEFGSNAPTAGGSVGVRRHLDRRAGGSPGHLRHRERCGSRAPS